MEIKLVFFITVVAGGLKHFWLDPDPVKTSPDLQHTASSVYFKPFSGHAVTPCILTQFLISIHLNWSATTLGHITDTGEVNIKRRLFLLSRIL